MTDRKPASPPPERAGKPVEIYREFRIEAAHYLPHLPREHKCRRLHGHSFRVQVWVAAPPDPQLGWVMDFADITARFQPIFEALDHRLLNEVPDLENPTSENLARWIWERLKPGLPELTEVMVRETCNSGCRYRG